MSTPVSAVAPAQPQGGPQDRQVISLQDRVASKIGEKPRENKKTQQRDEVDGAMTPEAAPLTLPTTSQLLRHRVSLGAFGGLAGLPAVARSGSKTDVPEHADMPAHRAAALDGSPVDPSPGAGKNADVRRGITVPNSHSHEARDAVGSVVQELGAVPRHPGMTPLPTKAGEHAPAGATLEADSNESPAVRFIPAQAGGAPHAGIAEPSRMGHQKWNVKRVREPVSAEPMLVGRQPSAAPQHEALPGHAGPQARASTVPGQPMQAALGSSRELSGSATKPATTELTYRFQSWGIEHAVKAQFMGAQGVITLNPSSARVNVALASSDAESATGTSWRIDATEASGDEDSARKRRG